MEIATQDEKNLVINRLQSLRSTIKLTIADDSGKTVQLTKTEMIKHVADDDKIGEMIIKAYMNYFRSLKGRTL